MRKKIIKDRKIRIGLVGCGRIAKNHIEAILAKPKDFELVACDEKDENLNQAILSQAVAKYNRYEAMLQQEDLDLVVLCTPSGLHASQAILAAKNGKNVLTEKPMATSWSDGLKMVNACGQAEVDLFVVKQNRLNPTVSLVKKAIDEGYFGKLYLLSSNVFWTRPQDYYDQAPWRGTWRMDGGALMNQASHYVDLLVWLGGPVAKTQALSATLARKIETEDSLVMNLQYRSGALGSMAVTMLTYPKNLEGSLTILGEKGSVRLGGAALNEILEWQFSDSSMISKEDAQSMNYNPPSVYGFGHAIYYQNLLNYFRGDPSVLTTGVEGLKSLEVMCAAQESAKLGQCVGLPLRYINV